MRVSSKFYVLWSSSYIVCQVVGLSIIFLCLMRVSSVFIFSVGIFVHWFFNNQQWGKYYQILNEKKNGNTMDKLNQEKR